MIITNNLGKLFLFLGQILKSMVNAISAEGNIIQNSNIEPKLPYTIVEPYPISSN